MDVLTRVFTPSRSDLRNFRTHAASYASVDPRLFSVVLQSENPPLFPPILLSRRESGDCASEIPQPPT